MNKNIELQLTDELSKFGLNPSQWMVSRKKANFYTATRKDDPSSLLAGRISFKKSRNQLQTTWKNLEWVLL